MKYSKIKLVTQHFSIHHLETEKNIIQLQADFGTAAHLTCGNRGYDPKKLPTIVLSTDLAFMGLWQNAANVGMRQICRRRCCGLMAFCPA